MKCVAHLLGLDWECRDDECETEEEENDGPGEPANSDSVLGASGLGDNETDSEEDERRTYKDPSAYRDQQSTGRKQAAKWFPLNPEALCEWAGKKNCGGGKHPITGCAANLQQARHHGPDKNTLNNEKGNVHRICHTCHNRWHTLNDDGYVWGGVHEPHDPKQATVQELVDGEEFWKGRKIVKAKD
jgi:hypothetical protein